MERFHITWVVENGQPHYKIVDTMSGTEIHCDSNELKETLYELMETEVV